LLTRFLGDRAAVEKEDIAFYGLGVVDVCHVRAVAVPMHGLELAVVDREVFGAFEI
jgi:hypothetical protein